MLTRGVRLALLLPPDKIVEQTALSARCPLKLYLDLSKSRYLRDISRLHNIVNLVGEISGIHFKLTQFKTFRPIDTASRLITRDMKLLLTLDTACTVHVRTFIHSLAVTYDLIPVIDLEDPVDRLPVLELTNIDTVIFKVPSKITRKFLRYLPYLKDYLDTILKTRTMTIGVIIEDVNINVLNFVKDILSLSSIIVMTSVNNVIQICEALCRRRSIIETLQELASQGQVMIDLNIE